MGLSFSQLLNPWVLFGFAGQGVFFLRFIVQWIATEKHKEIVVPMWFWYLSIIGTIMIFIYSVHIKDIVFTIAQVLSMFIYIRNIHINSQRSSAAR